MNTYFRLGSYAAAFASGIFAMWLWHNAAMNRIEAKDAKQETAAVTEVANAAINDGKASGENVGNYLSEYNAAKDEITTLRGQLRDGSVKLRVCAAEAKTAGLQSTNSSAIAEEARAASARYQEDAVRLLARGRDLDAWVNSAHAWINRP